MTHNPLHDRGAWRRLSRRVIAEEPTCWLRLPGCTQVSTTADHVQPVNTHPHLLLDRANVRGACSACNSLRGDTPPHLIDQLRQRLEQGKRRWVKPPPAAALQYFSTSRPTSGDTEIDCAATALTPETLGA